MDFSAYYVLRKETFYRIKELNIKNHIDNPHWQYYVIVKNF